MYCPQCKAEYRQGFRRCADCDVELVNSLPAAEEGAANRVAGGTLAPLWEGEDLALHTTLLEELEAAGLKYFDQAMSIYPGARFGDSFPIQGMTRFGYQVAVLSSDLASAKEILERLRIEKPQDMDLAVAEEERGERIERVADPDEQTICEIWVGQDERLAGFLQDALRENEILLRAEVAGAEMRIYVGLSDEQRAREIVREIVEAAPPE